MSAQAPSTKKQRRGEARASVPREAPTEEEDGDDSSSTSSGAATSSTALASSLSASMRTASKSRRVVNTDAYVSALQNMIEGNTHHVNRISKDDGRSDLSSASARRPLKGRDVEVTPVLAVTSSIPCIICDQLVTGQSVNTSASNTQRCLGCHGSAHAKCMNNGRCDWCLEVQTR